MSIFSAGIWTELLQVGQWTMTVSFQSLLRTLTTSNGRSRQRRDQTISSSEIEREREELREPLARVGGLNRQSNFDDPYHYKRQLKPKVLKSTRNLTQLRFMIRFYKTERAPIGESWGKMIMLSPEREKSLKGQAEKETKSKPMLLLLLFYFAVMSRWKWFEFLWGSGSRFS